MAVPPRFTLITAARLLDGSGAAPIEQAALLMEHGRVFKLGRAADVRVPDGASVDRKDYGAATILPGLVDAHTHLVAPGDGTLGDDIAKEDDDILLLQAAKNARTLLHSGVTTLRENGAKGKVAFSLREGIRRDEAQIFNPCKQHGLLELFIGGRGCFCRAGRNGSSK